MVVGRLSKRWCLLIILTKYYWGALRNHETFEMGLYPVCSIYLISYLLFNNSRYPPM